MSEAQETKGSPASDDCKSVMIRSRPKVIFLYPTFLVALLAGFWTLFSLGGGDAISQVSLTPGRIFWWVFAINLFGVAFDFTRGEFVALVLFCGVTTLSIILLDERFAFVRPVQNALSTIKLFAHPHFYFMLAGALGVCLAGVWLVGFFDYWEITHNEILHHKGVLGDLERFPAPNLRLTKEIPDLFEYSLFFPLGGAGKIVIHPHGSSRSVVLENVVGVNRIEVRIQKMLASLQVKVDTGHQHDVEQ
jgi:hypothetical protein